MPDIISKDTLLYVSSHRVLLSGLSVYLTSGVALYFILSGLSVYLTSGVALYFILSGLSVYLKSGVAEMLAMEMKTSGMYVTRSLSFKEAEVGNVHFVPQ